MKIKEHSRSAVKLFIGPNDEDNEQAFRTLSKLPDTEIEVVRGASTIVNYVPMPFIESNIGYRYFGLVGIESFVSKKK